MTVEDVIETLRRLCGDDDPATVPVCLVEITPHGDGAYLTEVTRIYRADEGIVLRP